MLTWILLFLIAVLILCYQRASIAVASIGISVLLLILSVLTQPPIIILAIIWAVWALFVIIFNTPLFRR